MEESTPQLKPVFQPNTANTFSVQAVQLRTSNLTLSKYDERMPSPLPPSKSPSYQKEKSGSWQGRLTGARGSLVEIKRSHSPMMLQMENRTVGPTFSKKLSAIRPGPGSVSSVPYQPASEEEELMARSQTSVLQEVSMRRRKTAIVIGCLCFVLFLAGCIITATSYSIADPLFNAGQIAGPTIVVCAGAAVISIACRTTLSDIGTDETIQRRQLLFASFKYLERELEKIELNRKSAERIITKIVSGADGDKAKT